ncbi:MAG: histidine--tRNA ligase [Planctomycetota bacterium]
MHLGVRRRESSELGNTGKQKPKRVKPRIGKGFRDIESSVLHAREAMITTIRGVYESFGFFPLETPAIEYVDCLGKFLPESDQPDAGIFAFRNDDDDWVALRYDLTAPLSRFVAMNPELSRPYRRYQVGPVYRVEKPGPGRFREFYQFDFDSVGTNAMLADAECAMVVCDTLEALGIARGDYVIRVNDRKVLNGVLERVSKEGKVDSATSMQVLRCIDKLDKIGVDGVVQLLGKGRKDESGAFIDGVGLGESQIAMVTDYLAVKADSRRALCDQLESLVGETSIGPEGVDELRQIDAALTAAGYAEDRVVFDPTVVRGLEYYTGPVFEGELTFEIVDEKGQKRQFGSVVSGGRYDGLIERFTGQRVPSTGGSVGVDRLLAALQALGKVDDRDATAPVLVTRIDKDLTSEYLQMAGEIRASGINVELYTGNQNIGKQFKYAGDSGKIIAIVMGSDEMGAGEVSIKDLRLGVELSKEIGADRKKWLEDQPAQFSVKRAALIESIRDVLRRYD